MDFYKISDDYISFLRNAEIEKRGTSKVPNINKGVAGTTQKFYCGIVLDINGISYFAPVSSYNIFDNRNFMIFNNEGTVISSIRFNYMVPIPIEETQKFFIQAIKDPGYKKLVSLEWHRCRKYESIIHQKAYQAYAEVINNYYNPQNMYVKNSCDFPLLERKCIEYCIEHNYEIPHRCDYPNLKGNCFFVKCTAQHKEAIAEILTQTTSDITKTDAGYTIAIHNCHKTKVVEICKKHGIALPESFALGNNRLKPAEPKQPQNETFAPPKHRR